MTKPKADIIVIGAGIVGVSTALWLQRFGHSVTIVDREGFAAGASYGNAGILETSGVIPVTTPGILFAAPKLLFSPNEPLFLRWSYLPKLLPFLWRYVGHATGAEMKRIAHALSPLIEDAHEQHLSVAQGTEASQYIHDDDYIYCYPRKQDFEVEASQWDLRNRLGHRFETLDVDALSEREPSLAGKFGFGVCTKDHGRISDPGAYVQALGAAFEKAGGTLVRTKVSNFKTTGGRVTELITDEGSMTAEDVVIAAGAWSGELMKQLGVSISMEAERGYHIEFANPNIKLNSTVMIRQKKFAMNSMNGRLRCGGIVEFGGLEAGPSTAPFELLKRNVKSVLPELTYDRIDYWMGHRPSTSDSLPVMGKVEPYANVWAGFGHQHLGLTAGPKSGRLLAQLISGETPNLDLTSFSPNRFQ